MIYFQVAFYEIMAGLWVRNGLQIKGQAMTYIQCHFCKSMVDAALFLLQLSERMTASPRQRVTALTALVTRIVRNFGS